MSETLAVGSTLRRERTTLGLVSGAHFFSHFYFLVLPPLFIAIKLEMGISFTQLGFMMTLYALGSATGQYPIGVLSDKFSARWFLIGGMIVVSVCFILMGFSDAYWQLLVLALLAGFGDSVFHPTDFAIISSQIEEKRLGRAYAIHAFMGFVGFAVAPVVVDLLRVNWNWHVSVVAVGMAGLVMAIILFICRELLNTQVSTAPLTKNENGRKTLDAIGFLKSGAILVMFIFYILVALSGSGIQQFSTSALPLLYDVNVSDATRALFVYMVGISLGVLVGGGVADKFFRFNVIATTGYLIASILMIVVAFSWLPFIFVVVAFFVGGFMMGIVFPSRDLMVRKISSKESAGKAFGFVNSGFGYGSMVGPLICGMIMDTGFTQGIFLMSAAIMILVIVTAILADALTRTQSNAQPAQ